MYKHALTMLVASVLALGGPEIGDTGTLIVRYNWVPDSSPFGPRMGDLWTFVCPKGGRVSVEVDTIDDGSGTSSIDPHVQIFDGHGGWLGSGHDEKPCWAPPVCGGGCPSVSVPCGDGPLHSIIVKDFGASGPCTGGDEYQLIATVRDPGGNFMDERAIKFGGGPKRKIPAWINLDWPNMPGPALDDEGLDQ